MIYLRNNTRPSLVFFMLALAVLIVAPLVILILPLMAVETLYFNKNNIVLITPKENFILLTLAFVGVISALLLLAWKRKTTTYVIVVILLILSGVAAVQSPKSYIAIDEEGVQVQKYNQLAVYKWSDMTDILYEFSETDAAYYTFTLSNGENVKIVENGQMISKRGSILSLARKHDIPLQEKEI